MRWVFDTKKVLVNDSANLRIKLEVIGASEVLVTVLSLTMHDAPRRKVKTDIAKRLLRTKNTNKTTTPLNQRH